MSYDQAVSKLVQIEGVEVSTMMKTPCLRYKGNFMAMMFDKEESLIVKLPSDRVKQLVEEGNGNEFNFTKKTFKEWVLIPIDFEDEYESYIQESLEYAKSK